MCIYTNKRLFVQKIWVDTRFLEKCVAGEKLLFVMCVTFWCGSRCTRVLFHFMFFLLLEGVSLLNGPKLTWIGTCKLELNLILVLFYWDPLLTKLYLLFSPIYYFLKMDKCLFLDKKRVGWFLYKGIVK